MTGAGARRTSGYSGSTTETAVARIHFDRRILYWFRRLQSCYEPWYHVAVTRSGSLFSFYLDGAVSSTATSSVSIPNANAPLTLGQAEGIAFLGGDEDEIAIYSRALNASEIAAVYSAGSAREVWFAGCRANTTSRPGGYCGGQRHVHHRCQRRSAFGLPVATQRRQP